MDDRAFLFWLSDRLNKHYGESKNVDFVTRLNDIAEGTPMGKTTGRNPKVDPLTTAIIDAMAEADLTSSYIDAAEGFRIAEAAADRYRKAEALAREK